MPSSNMVCTPHMARYVRKLTETECKKARPMEKDYKLYDEGNLRLLIRKSGTKVWQYPFRQHGKENIYTIGQYPNVGLADARKARDEARAMVDKGVNPNQEKASRFMTNSTGAANSFETIAREWHSKQVWDAKHAQTVLRTLEANAFPVIGCLPIHKITAQNILFMLRGMEEREALDMARRVNQRCEAVFDYAIVKGLCENNPASGRSKVLKTRARKHRPHLQPKYIPEFMAALGNYRGGLKVRLAMQLLWLTFVRPGELRKARWEDFDEEGAMWRIPAEQMKMKRPHLVPLSTQALQLLKELRPISGKSKLLFPSANDPDKPISDVTLTKVLIILGFHDGGKNNRKPSDEEHPKSERHFVPHGIRGTASTILNEIGRFKPDVIERQLAHIETNSVRAAYNHAEYLEERIEMMQWWAEYLST